MNIFLMSPIPKSQVMLDSALVLSRNSVSISHLNEQVSSIKSILLTFSQANNGNTTNDEMQVARQYRIPGGGDLVGGFQEMGTVQSGRNTHSVSASKLVEWLCQLQCCLVFLRWLQFEWSLSLKFEISLATVRHIEITDIGPDSNEQRFSLHAMAVLELGQFSLVLTPIQTFHYVVASQMLS